MSLSPITHAGEYLAGQPQRKVVFVLSETRSGSTWLSYVLGSHPDSAFLGEYCRPFLQPGHVACRLCEAKGMPECAYLHGIGQVKAEAAFDFAFSRMGKSILVDCSKKLDWVGRFVNSTGFTAFAIHLHRDPRAWYTSLKRRRPELSTGDAMQRWVDTNTTISRHLNDWALTQTTAWYDELASAPDHHFPEMLGKTLGTPFDRAALSYWRTEHHGLAGNGAAYNVLRSYDMSRTQAGDDPFYAINSDRLFHDARWREELGNEDRKAIENSPLVNDYLASHGRGFDHFDRLLDVTV